MLWVNIVAQLRVRINRSQGDLQGERLPSGNCYGDVAITAGSCAAFRSTPNARYRRQCQRSPPAAGRSSAAGRRAEPPAAASPSAPTPDPSHRSHRSRSGAHSRLGCNAEAGFRGGRRSNATRASTTDADARLFRNSRGAGAILCFMGHALMENRTGLIVQAELARACGHAERRATLDMVHRHARPLAISRGSKLPSRWRGTSISNAPPRSSASCG
jgi:hypothetical protein